MGETCRARFFALAILFGFGMMDSSDEPADPDMFPGGVTIAVRFFRASLLVVRPLFVPLFVGSPMPPATSKLFSSSDESSRASFSLSSESTSPLLPGGTGGGLNHCTGYRSGGKGVRASSKKPRTLSAFGLRSFTEHLEPQEVQVMRTFSFRGLVRKGARQSR